MTEERITASYLMQLQAMYYEIGERGIRVDTKKMALNKLEVLRRIKTQLEIASKQWGCCVFIGAENAPKADPTSVNLNATQGERALLKKLTDMGYNVPKITKKNEEGDYESRYSTGELALQKMLAENQFNYSGGDPAIRAVLQVRELGKLKSGYLNTRLVRRASEGLEEPESFFLTSYNVGGTVTGRRSSKRHIFRYGNNAQNFPSHSDTAALIQECLIAREGHILLFNDQVTAEEWPVSALSKNVNALQELRTGVDRHSALASKIFGEFIPAKTDPRWDSKLHSMKRYMGKKVKHARNYGMHAKRMSESLAQEGISMSVKVCQQLLEIAASVDPSVEFVFQAYIRECLSNEHLLKTPFGRERMFLGARPGVDNSTIFNEAYSYIPQSTVGDNTGFTVYKLESEYPSKERAIIQEGHDSTVQDIPDSSSTVWEYLQRTIRAFHRVIRFHNGIEVEIPIDAEIGYDFRTKVKLKSLTEKGVQDAYLKLQELREKKRQEERELHGKAAQTIMV